MSGIAGRIRLVTGDITTLDVQAVVTAANKGLRGGGGVDGAVHRAAGPELLHACRAVAPCPTGQSRLTPGLALAADWVIHTVGPIYRDGNSGEAELLASAYWTALALAVEHSIDGVAFPCISTGVYGYPADAACDIAIESVHRWVQTSNLPRVIIFCCFGDADFQRYESRLRQVGLLSEA